MQTCNECGRYVTESFARVFGDNNDEVWGCIQCGTIDGGGFHDPDIDHTSKKR